MNNINLKLNNNYTVAQLIFDEVLIWAASKKPNTKEQIIDDIENILDKIEEKGYDKARGGCCGGNYSYNGHSD